MKNFHFSRLIAGAILTLALSVSLTSSTDAWQGNGTPGQGAPFTGIVAFGDSLSDTGNAFALTMGAFPPEPFYYEGHFSNGNIWIEYLAGEMRLDPESVVNYAVGGATTGSENATVPGLPGLQREIDQFESDLGRKSADKRALYIVWAGANDIFVGLESGIAGAYAATPTAVSNTKCAVQRLHDVGARRIMVVNLPDLGLTPSFNFPPPLAEAISDLSDFYNGSLDLALGELEAEGIETIRVDSASVLRDVAANPGEFGFSNVTDAYLTTGGDPSGFLFWDSVHPTTNGHFFIADEAMRTLRSKFPHVWGTPRNRR